MSLERDDALELFFLESSGRGRSAGDAVAIAVPLCVQLAAVLAEGAELGAEFATPKREDIDRRARNTAIALGEAAVDAMRGLIIAGAVDLSMPLPRGGDPVFAPLYASWQAEPSPYRSAVAVIERHIEALDALGDDPDGVYDRLPELVSLAADIAAWTVWTEL
jgi:hypothetical protein